MYSQWQCWIFTFYEKSYNRLQSVTLLNIFYEKSWNSLPSVSLPNIFMRNPRIVYNRWHCWIFTFYEKSCNSLQSMTLPNIHLCIIMDHFTLADCNKVKKKVWPCCKMKRSHYIHFCVASEERQYNRGHLTVWVYYLFSCNCWSSPSETRLWEPSSL